MIKEKVISNVYCVENDNLILIKDCVLVNCYNGIAIISIKNKEMIQYIEMEISNTNNKIIKKSSGNIIYIWRSFYNVDVYIFEDHKLKLVKVINCLREFDELSEYSDYSFVTYYDFLVTRNSLIFHYDLTYFIVDYEEDEE